MAEKNSISANKKYRCAAIVEADNGGGPSSEDEICRRRIVTTEDKPGKSHNNIILRQDYVLKKTDLTNLKPNNDTKSQTV